MKGGKKTNKMETTQEKPKRPEYDKYTDVLRSLNRLDLESGKVNTRDFRKRNSQLESVDNYHRIFGTYWTLDANTPEGVQDTHDRYVRWAKKFLLMNGPNVVIKPYPNPELNPIFKETGYIPGLGLDQIITYKPSLGDIFRMNPVIKSRPEENPDLKSSPREYIDTSQYKGRDGEYYPTPEALETANDAWARAQKSISLDDKILDLNFPLKRTP